MVELGVEIVYDIWVCVEGKILRLLLNAMINMMEKSCYLSEFLSTVLKIVLQGSR